MINTNHTINENSLTAAQRQLRSNIRNAWFCESSERIHAEINERQKRGDWFAVAILLDLLIDYQDDQ